MGKLTEVYKPQLGFAKDSLEIRWEVEGKSLKVELPRSNLKLNKVCNGMLLSFFSLLIPASYRRLSTILLY